MKNKNTGLALGGGAVLGAAHVGTLKALEEYNLPVDYIAGTSIGAFVAAFYAFGLDCDEIKKIALQLKWMDLSGISLSRYGLLSNEKMGKLLEKYIGKKNLEDAKIPLAVIATDISTGDRVVLDQGPVAQAVMASTCIPGIFKPVKINGRYLVDGGIVENIPIKTTRKLGAKFVIGVDLNGKFSYQKPNNLLDVIVNSFHFLMQNAEKFQIEKADLLIQPDLSGFNRSDTAQVEQLIQRGYEDSKNALKSFIEAQ